MSSFRMLADRDQDIKERYKDIKAKNERLKAQTYAQYLKMSPTNQTRFMSAYDVKEGKIQMTFVKPVITQVVPFDSQGNTDEVTTNQSLGHRF